MILSEQQRRWSEIKYYYFCLDIYHINNDMIEVILLIEAIAHIGQLDYKLLKNITGKILADPYYLPVKDEVISLAYAYGLSKSEISRQFSFNRATINVVLQNQKRNTLLSSIPLLSVAEDQEMYKFCKLLPSIQKAGVYEKEKEN